MKLSKSRYCNALQCYKMLWLLDNKKEVMEDIKPTNVLDNGTKVGEVAKDLFGQHIDISYNSDLNQMINDTNKALENKKVVITEASFNYDDNFCSVDILRKDGNNLEIYEVKSSTEVHDIYKEDLSYQVYILLNLGYKIKKACIVYLNNKYERHGKLDLVKLFNIFDYTKEAISKKEEIKIKIDEIRKYMNNKEEQDKDIDMYCFSPYDCPFFKYCSRNLVVPNVFNISGMNLKTKVNLYKQGNYSYKDLLNSNINPKYREIIDYELNDLKPRINKEEIKNFLNTLSYPIYYLDFETYQMPIPEYDYVKPFMQIPFQYSLHIKLDENTLIHKEFLAKDSIDPRKSLVEALVDDIPQNVCVLAYNMSFEKTVIKNLSYMFPEYSNHLMNIYDNINDLIIPFKNKDYYTKDMHGKTSIKYVLPALFPNDEKFNYQNLEGIHKGDEASNAYANLGNLSGKEKEKVRNQLLKYCELDTYAMVKIHEKLIELVK